MRSSTSALAVFLLWATPARAVDTLEGFGPAGVNFEHYLGLTIAEDGEAGLAADAMLGYGLAAWLSVYGQVTLEPTTDLAEGTGRAVVGGVVTPVDTDHFDLDVQLAWGLRGDRLKQHGLKTEIELNFDRRPNLESWGLYTRWVFPIFQLGLGDEPDAPFHLHAIFGSYVTLAEIHQLLLEVDPTYHGETSRIGIGGAALGYNLMLSDVLELVNQVVIDIPEEGEALAVQVMVGVILTVPEPQ